MGSPPDIPLQGKLSVNEAFALDKIVSLIKPQENRVSERDSASKRYQKQIRSYSW
jgi:hypothetical protein